jgi:uncharacterized membrane protein YfcA
MFRSSNCKIRLVIGRTKIYKHIYLLSSMDIMDFKLFFGGLLFLVVAYLIYRGVKNERPSSEATNWEGPTLSTYVGLWGSVVLCGMVGIGFILKSLLGIN